MAFTKYYIGVAVQWIARRWTASVLDAKELRNSVRINESVDPYSPYLHFSATSKSSHLPFPFLEDPDTLAFPSAAWNHELSLVYTQKGERNIFCITNDRESIPSLLRKNWIESPDMGLCEKWEKSNPMTSPFFHRKWCREELLSKHKLHILGPIQFQS